MAIIRSIAVGKARKSAGNLTFRTVRGRTIASEKVGERATTRVPGQYTIYEALFKLISMYIGMHRSSINVSFDKSKYGSQGNYFYKINKAALNAAFGGLTSNVDTVTPEDLEEAVAAYAEAHPNSIYRVKLTGFETVYLTGAWSDEDNPVAGGSSDALGKGEVTTTVGSTKYTSSVTLSLSYHSGAKVVRPSGKVTIEASALPAGITASEIKYLTIGGAELSTPVTVTNVTSAAGSLSFNATEIAEADNVLAMKVKNIYIRLSSAYVEHSDNQGANPLG